MPLDSLRSSGFQGVLAELVEAHYCRNLSRFKLIPEKRLYQHLGKESFLLKRLSLGITVFFRKMRLIITLGMMPISNSFKMSNQLVSAWSCKSNLEILT
jgi:hypothetical protein